MASATKSFSVVMSFERATKRTYRFNEFADGDAKIGVQYIQKQAFVDVGQKTEPKKIKVTVEVIE